MYIYGLMQAMWHIPTYMYGLVQAMMDRRKKKELPSMQVGFIQFVCMPLYEKLAQFSDQLRPLLNGVINNKNNWQHLADNPNGESRALDESCCYIFSVDNWDDPVLLSPSDCVIIHVKPCKYTNFVSTLIIYTLAEN